MNILHKRCGFSEIRNKPSASVPIQARTLSEGNQRPLWEFLQQFFPYQELNHRVLLWHAGCNMGGQHWHSNSAFTGSARSSPGHKSCCLTQGRKYATTRWIRLPAGGGVEASSPHPCSKTR